MTQNLRYLALVTMIVLSFQMAHGQNPLKIMPLGNSITQGWTDGSLTVEQMKGYRYDLKQLLQNAGYVTDFVGSETSGSLFFSDCQHAGIGGSRDQYVARLLEDGYDERHLVQILNPPRPYLDEYKPDVILLHIGTNDVTHEVDIITNQKVSRILDLVDEYELRSNREVIVFLALIVNRKKPWVAGSGASTTSSFNNAIKAIAQVRINAGDKIVIVDHEHNAGFYYDSRDMADDLHPNAAGYTKMANLWFDSIVANYNLAPSLTPIPDQYFEEGGDVTISLDNYITDKEDHDSSLTWTITPIDTENLTFIFNSTTRQVKFFSQDSNWYGTQSFVFKVTDRGKRNKYVKSVIDTVRFFVSDVNDPPFFISDPVLTVNKGEVYTYSFSAEDLEQTGNLFFSIENKPDWLSYIVSSDMLVGIPPEHGEFPVTLKVSDGIDESEQSFKITVTDTTLVSTIEHSENIGIFPIPASNYIKFLLPGEHNEMRLIIYDISGVSVQNKTICKDCEPVLYLNQKLSSGIYFYEILYNQKKYTGKLLIKR